MKRRDLIRKVAVAALMATPAMQALQFARDFGLPDGSPFNSTFFRSRADYLSIWIFEAEMHGESYTLAQAMSAREVETGVPDDETLHLMRVYFQRAVA